MAKAIHKIVIRRKSDGKFLTKQTRPWHVRAGKDYTDDLQKARVFTNMSCAGNCHEWQVQTPDTLERLPVNLTIIGNA